MNIRVIKDLLIDAVRLDRETHEHVGPAHLRAQQLAYAHDFQDMAGWGRTPGDKKCQLDSDDGDPYRALRLAFWEQYDRDPSPAEISRAQAVHGWIRLVDDEKDRRALIGWLHSKAGGKSFRRWCKQVEGISQTTGLKRKDRALLQIQENIPGDVVLHDFDKPLEDLLFANEIGDVSATIATGADEGIDHWSAADAKPEVHVQHIGSRREVEVPRSEMTWAEKQNARRRQREAAKRKKMADADGLVHDGRKASV